MKDWGLQRHRYVHATLRWFTIPTTVGARGTRAQDSVPFDCVFWNLFPKDVEPVIWQALFMG